MIITFILNALITFVNGFFFLVPAVELPEGVYDFLASGVGYYKLFTGIFPPADLFLSLALWVFSFKLGLIVLKFFFGSRLPTLN